MDKDRVIGSAKQIKGTVKQVVGKTVGDAKLEAEGNADKIEGQGSERHRRRQGHAQREIGQLCGYRWPRPAASNCGKITFDGDRAAAPDFAGTDPRRRCKARRVRSCIGLFNPDRRDGKRTRHQRKRSNCCASVSPVRDTGPRLQSRKWASAVVRITDRGPFVSGRIIDVSQIAAHELGFCGFDEGLPQDPVNSGNSTDQGKIIATTEALSRGSATSALYRRPPDRSETAVQRIKRREPIL